MNRVDGGLDLARHLEPAEGNVTLQWVVDYLARYCLSFTVQLPLGQDRRPSAARLDCHFCRAQMGVLAVSPLYFQRQLGCPYWPPVTLGTIISLRPRVA